MQAGPTQISRAFKVIREHLELNPTLFQTEGMFRISAAHSRVNALLTQIYSNDLSLDLKQYNVHECIGVLNIALGNEPLILPTDERVVIFSQWFRNVKLDDETVHIKAMNAFDNFLHSLIDSALENDHLIAEILLDYFYLIKRAYESRDSNLMTSQNLARILSPVLMDQVLSIPSVEIHALMPIISKICEKLIETDYFQKPKCLNNVRYLQSKYESMLVALEDESIRLSEATEKRHSYVSKYELEKMQLLADKNELVQVKSNIESQKSKMSQKQYKQQIKGVIAKIIECDQKITDCQEALELCQLFAKSADQKYVLHSIRLNSAQRSLAFLENFSESNSSPSLSASSSQSNTPRLMDDSDSEGVGIVPALPLDRLKRQYPL